MTGHVIETVVKLGGGLLAHVAHFDAALRAIGAAARERRLLIVPGGGPFADAVRAIDRRLSIGDEAAHWMAVLAMDQYAHLVASRLDGATLVFGPDDLAGLHDGSTVPVLAPYRWLRRADPLPHLWDVTSDSIAAWVAGELGVRRLVLVKPPGARSGLVDSYFTRTLPARITPVIVAGDEPAALYEALTAG